VEGGRAHAEGRAAHCGRTDEAGTRQRTLQASARPLPASGEAARYESAVSEHVRDGRKQDSRVWAWALAAIIVFAGIMLSVGVNWKQHAPQPLLEFLEHAGPGGPISK